MDSTLAAVDPVIAHWRTAWPEALAIWSRYIRLGEPRWCRTPLEAKQEGLTDSFAMIRLRDQAIVVDVEQVKALGLEPFALEILAHEIGHHVYTPASVTEAARLIARMRRALPAHESEAALVANLYEDLLINDRLHRTRELDVPGVYRRMEAATSASTPPENTTRLWTLYMRIYEILWSLPRRTLARALDPADAALEGDAQLGARLVRVYARDWMTGGGRFAALCLPYLDGADVRYVRTVLKGWLDTESAAQGAGLPSGLVEIEDDEASSVMHPSADPALSGLPDDETDDDEGHDGGDERQKGKKPRDTRSPSMPQGRLPGGGQNRLPFEYGAILRALGLNLSDHDIAMSYYRERARPHLVSFPTRRQPESDEPQVEGLEAWDIGSPLDDVDWLESVLVSPRIVPGVTTRQRVYGRMAGPDPTREALDLDLYVDCSGSMPNPQSELSYLTLAGAIMCLSALRVGARVQVTLWSGPGQFEKTKGFITDEATVMRVLTGYICGGTAFPLHVLVDTYGERAAAPRRRKTHLMVISDSGVDTMLEKDERGVDGAGIVREALEKAGGGGTLLLNLSGDWRRYPGVARTVALGWDIFCVTSWEQVVDFARAFSRKTYGEEASA